MSVSVIQAFRKLKRASADCDLSVNRLHYLNLRKSRSQSRLLHTKAQLDIIVQRKAIAEQLLAQRNQNKRTNLARKESLARLNNRVRNEMKRGIMNSLHRVSAIKLSNAIQVRQSTALNHRARSEYLQRQYRERSRCKDHGIPMHRAVLARQKFMTEKIDHIASQNRQQINGLQASIDQQRKFLKLNQREERLIKVNLKRSQLVQSFLVKQVKVLTEPRIKHKGSTTKL